MRLETTAGQLRAALSCMVGVIERRNTIPVLGCIKIEGGEIVGTDLDMEVRVSLPTMGNVEGAAVVDWRGLLAIARTVDADETLRLAGADGRTSIAFNGSDYTLPSLPISDFPDRSAVAGEPTRAANMGLLAAMRRVQFAVLKEETRYYLNGVALLAGPDGPLVAATDGHRLALMPLPSMPDNAAGAIVPSKLVQWLVAHKSEPEAVVFDVEHHRSSFSFPGLSVWAKLIDGAYPDIFRVIPKDPKPVFSIDRQTALRALRRLAAFSIAFGRAAAGVKLEGGETLRLSMERFSEASASETIAFATSPAIPFSAGYNVHYLIAALSRLTGDTVTFAVSEGDAIAGAPVEITSDNDALRIVQMPMRV